MAIIHDEDSFHIMDLLGERGFSVTKLASTGGFLRAGNTTLICGVEDAKASELTELIEKTCKARKQKKLISDGVFSGMSESGMPYPVEVNVGGATIFVVNVEEFKKV